MTRTMPMDGGLHRLVYHSRTQIEDKALDDAVADILNISQRNNAEVGVTGALMFNAGCFGQVLEGGRDALVATFARIQRDPRHRDVSLLAFEPIASRSFGHWSMGFVGHRPPADARFDAIGRSSAFDPALADGDSLLSALKALAVSSDVTSPSD